MSDCRTVHFERRSLLYARYDAQLSLQTRFFAAASAINAVLAQCFAILPGFPSQPSFQFLNEVGAALEIDNVTYAQTLQARPPGIQLDRALVCGEQRKLQRYVDAHRLQRPHLWKRVHGEINGLLNDRCATPLLAHWSTDGRRLCRVLREARGQVGGKIDFAEPSHRILIGVELIERIRQNR